MKNTQHTQTYTHTHTHTIITTFQINLEGRVQLPQAVLGLGAITGRALNLRMRVRVHRDVCGCARIIIINDVNTCSH